MPVARCLIKRKKGKIIGNVEIPLLLQIGEWSPTGGVYSHLDDETVTENVTIGGKVYVVTSIEVSNLSSNILVYKFTCPCILIVTLRHTRQNGA